jgi:hypothetical protein
MTASFPRLPGRYALAHRLVGSTAPSWMSISELHHHVGRAKAIEQREVAAAITEFVELGDDRLFSVHVHVRLTSRRKRPA